MTRAKIRRQVLYPETVADKDIVVPTRKRKPWEQSEGYLQAQCILLVKRAMKQDPDLQFLATMTENPRNPVRASVAQMMGLKKGPSDLLLMRRMELKVTGILGQYPPPPFPLCKLAWVEFKLPGKKLTPEQAAWHAWFAGVAECHVVTSKEQFASILAAF